MYLSKLTLVPANRKALRDVSDPYQLHRTIMRAFPDAKDGGPGRVLFRLEPTRDDALPVVLVQSDKRPDWCAVETGAGYLQEARSKEVHLHLCTGQRLRFRLRANPTVKRDGKRHGLAKDDDQRRWLERKGQEGGFNPTDFMVRRSIRHVSRNAKGRQVHLGVDFEGILEVVDPQTFSETIRTGVGTAKGYGFGLLSVGPV